MLIVKKVYKDIIFFAYNRLQGKTSDHHSTCVFFAASAVYCSIFCDKCQSEGQFRQWKQEWNILCERWYKVVCTTFCLRKKPFFRVLEAPFLPPCFMITVMARQLQVAIRLVEIRASYFWRSMCVTSVPDFFCVRLNFRHLRTSYVWVVFFAGSNVRLEKWWKKAFRIHFLRKWSLICSWIRSVCESRVKARWVAVWDLRKRKHSIKLGEAASFLSQLSENTI